MSEENSRAVVLDELQREFLLFAHMYIYYKEYRGFNLMMMKKIEKKYNSLW